MTNVMIMIVRTELLVLMVSMSTPAPVLLVTPDLTVTQVSILLISYYIFNNFRANGGTCVDGVNSYTCDCVLGYSGPYCNTIVRYRYTTSLN